MLYILSGMSQLFKPLHFFFYTLDAQKLPSLHPVEIMLSKSLSCEHFPYARLVCLWRAILIAVVLCRKHSTLMLFTFKNSLGSALLLASEQFHLSKSIIAFLIRQKINP